MLGQTYRSPDPRRDGRDITVVEMLAGSIDTIKTAFADEDETRWKLLHHIAKSYASLGLADESTRMFQELYDEQRRVSAKPSSDTVTNMYDLAQSLNNKGHYDRADQLMDEAFKHAVEIGGENSQLALKLRGGQAFQPTRTGETTGRDRNLPFSA